MNTMTRLVMLCCFALALTLTLAACQEEEPVVPPAPLDDAAQITPDVDPDAVDDEHVHDEDEAAHDHEHADEHEHGEEVPLGIITIGDFDIEAAQGHGSLEPGKEMHLIIKLPYTDNGETIVRAWLGTESRLASIVGKGEYAAGHDDYDIHAIAPDPLPENTLWWIEIETPEGEKYVGSIEPL